MKKILLLGAMACIVTSCQTLDSVKSGFSNSFDRVGNMFASPSEPKTPCPSFVISEELDNYYDLPGAAEQAQNAGLSSATIQNISGECRMNENADILTVSLDIDFAATAGGIEAESEESTILEIPYFIAVVSEKEDVLVRDNFTIPLEILASKINISHTERLQQNIWVMPDSDPSTYTIITGFQLSESQLAYAKQAEKAPKKVTKIEPAAGKTVNADNVVGADPFAGR